MIYKKPGGMENRNSGDCDKDMGRNAEEQLLDLT